MGQYAGLARACQGLDCSVQLHGDSAAGVRDVRVRTSVHFSAASLLVTGGIAALRKTPSPRTATAKQRMFSRFPPSSNASDESSRSRESTRQSTNPTLRESGDQAKGLANS